MVTKEESKEAFPLLGEYRALPCLELKNLVFHTGFNTGTLGDKKNSLIPRWYILPQQPLADLSVTSQSDNTSGQLSDSVSFCDYLHTVHPGKSAKL